MKEPKFPKLEDLPKDNKYDFFADGILPEEDDEKRDKNRSSRKKNRIQLSLPADKFKKIPNTQKDDDLVPFFAKNYPQSSESKEDICYINSPPPSDTPDNTGEAEEVDLDEEESDEENDNKEKNKKNNNKSNNTNTLNNDEIGVSVDFNSEMEAEYENHSKMTSKEEVMEMIRLNQERKKREERERKEKEEMERKKKLEEEEKKKKEEEKKKKKKEKKKEKKKKKKKKKNKKKKKKKKKRKKKKRKKKKKKKKKKN